MRDDLVRSLMLSVACLIVGCQAQDNSGSSGAGSGGGGAAAAGSSAGSVGGAGAATSIGAAGSIAFAGSTSSNGGSAAAGGAVAGSTAGIGGSAGVGGSAGIGGGAGVGGGAGTSSASAGASGQGGSSALGGAAGASFAGSAGSVGAAGTAGAASSDPPCPTPTPRTGGKQYCSPPSNGSAGGNYSYDLWSDNKGTGCITVYGVDAAFKANWMNVGDWIARVGLSFDKSKTYAQLGTFSSDFAYTMTGVTSGGFGNVGIYGWSVSPLHEFYIEENWLGKPPNFTKVASFTIDGEGTYEVMTNTQTNQPNITGTNATFVQFWSVRTTPRQCGHISISKHFDEWASLGLQLGNLEEARISVEGQNNSGTIDFTTATLVVAK